MTAQPLTPKLPALWSDMDPYLKGFHLQGHTVTAEIQRMELMNLHPRPGVSELSLVVYFKGKNKGLILNSTNKKFLRENFGNKIKDCIGQTVTLTPTKKLVMGKNCEPIVLGIPKMQSAPMEKKTP